MTDFILFEHPSGVMALFFRDSTLIQDWMDYMMIYRAGFRPTLRGSKAKKKFENYLDSINSEMKVIHAEGSLV